MTGPAIASTVSRILSWWRKLSPLPGGRWIFSKLLGMAVPYTGSIKATVVKLEPGDVICELRDRRRVRNHLDSIHAIALANLGELTSGLAQMSMLSPDQRGIVTNLSIEYFKKARGTLRAESKARSPVVDNDDIEMDVTCDIRDTTDDVVARTTVTWRIGTNPHPATGA